MRRLIKGFRQHGETTGQQWQFFSVRVGFMLVSCAGEVKISPSVPNLSQIKPLKSNSENENYFSSTI
jgi:hypothetical protein